MKRARIMLLVIAAFATIGTALAFKVKKMGSTEYCYKVTTVQPSPGECKTCLAAGTADRSPGGTMVYYTITSNCDNCANATTLQCTSTATLPFKL